MAYAGAQEGGEPGGGRSERILSATRSHAPQRARRVPDLAATCGGACGRVQWFPVTCFDQRGRRRLALLMVGCRPEKDAGTVAGEGQWPE